MRGWYAGARSADSCLIHSSCSQQWNVPSVGAETDLHAVCSIALTNTPGQVTGEVATFCFEFFAVATSKKNMTLSRTKESPEVHSQEGRGELTLEAL